MTGPISRKYSSGSSPRVLAWSELSLVSERRNNTSERCVTFRNDLRVAFGDRIDVEEGKAGLELMRSDFRDIPGLHYLWSVSMTLKLGIVPDRLSTNNLLQRVGFTFDYQAKQASSSSAKVDRSCRYKRLNIAEDDEWRLEAGTTYFSSKSVAITRNLAANVSRRWELKR